MSSQNDVEPADPCQDGILEGVLFRPLTRRTDARGWLMELFRQDEWEPACHPVMAYISQTEPGQSRGPHEHVDQMDILVFPGPGDFLLQMWDARPPSATHGRQHRVVVGQSNPQAVLIPPGVVHGYRNISADPGLVINAPNRLYRGPGRREEVDEVRHENDPYSPYQLD